MKIRKVKPVVILLFVYLLYTYFYELIDIFGKAPLSYGTLVIPSLCIVFLFLTHNNYALPKYGLKMFFGWWVIVLYALIYNASFKHGIYFDSIRLVVVIILTYALMNLQDWEESSIHIMTLFGGVHVFATLLFFVSNDIFQQFILPLFEYAPVGSNNGLEGYHSGLSDHYSLNGTYCAVTTIILGAQLISDLATKKRVKPFQMVLFVAASIALLLTSKRAHLVFSVVSLFFVYYIVNPEKRSNKLVKAGMFFLLACLVIVVLVETGSPLAETFNRFLSENDGDISNGRFVMWLLALSEFLQAPLFGIGWLGYRYAYAENLFVGGNYAGGEYLSSFMYLDTHNVYLQVLCETGIIGFIALLFAMISPLLNTCKMIHTALTSDQDETKILSVSLGIQIFMLVYCMTGCCLNDITFLIYMMSIGIWGAIHQKKRREDLGIIC